MFIIGVTLAGLAGLALILATYILTEDSWNGVHVRGGRNDGPRPLALAAAPERMSASHGRHSAGR